MRKVLFALAALAAALAFLPVSDTASAASTGLLNPSANAADTGGDNNGFELNPTNAYADSGGYASNIDGAGDRHRYHGYGISVPAGDTINGIEVRLDWWLDGTAGKSTMCVELSWDGGSTWTSEQCDSQETTSEHTVMLGSSTDTWGRTWAASELSDSNFRVRVSSLCSGSPSQCGARDYYLDWVAADVYYTTGTPEPTPTPSPTPAPGSVEDTYAADGPWAVSTGSASDGLGNTFSLWYPANLGAGGYDHPILTWGNGTNATPQQYADTLALLASWGFVVVASDSTQTGLGTEILAGATYMVAKNSDPASIFYQNLDTDSIGAFGHSQGAGGTLNATLMSNGLIKSAITNALPNPIWWSSPVPDMSTWPTSVPIWFSRGTNDRLIASESEAQNWYNSVPGAAAKASLKRANHNTIQNDDNGYQGYYVAWFKYTLEGDSFARGAFVGSPPEINTNGDWQDQAQKNLP
jgi:hypothetical protein